MIVGRIVGDILTTFVALQEIEAGIGIAGGGVAACGTGVLCLATPAAITLGAGVAAVGAATATSAAVGLGENSQVLFSRETEHGEMRSNQGRPTGSAWTDAQKAGKNGVLYDAETGNYIVKGDKGRIHVFKLENGSLKLHTSFENTARNTQKRILSGKWEYITEDEYSWWCETLNSTLGGD